MKTDRRSRKTIGAIQNTTLQLLCTRRLGEIKIVDLCMAADINRTTFYLHFRNIREVLASLCNEIADRINADKRAAAFPKMGGTLEFLTSCAAVIGNFEYFEEFVRKSADADVFLTSLKNVLADRLYAHFCELYANVQLEAKCIIRFLTGGCSISMRNGCAQIKPYRWKPCSTFVPLWCGRGRICSKKWPEIRRKRRSRRKFKKKQFGRARRKFDLCE